MDDHFLVDRPENVADAPYLAVARANPFSLGGLIASGWRHRLAFASVFLACMAAACLIVLSLRENYESEATLVIDPRQNRVVDTQAVQDQAATLSDLNFVRTQMQLLAGDDLARRVVTTLDLAHDPILRSPPNLAARLLSPLLGSSAPETPDASRAIDEAAARYKDRFGTFSDGKSFIISAWFTAPDPALAQRVLQTHLQLFQAQQVAAKRQTIARAETWFDGELHSLQARLLASEARQQAFQENGKLFRAAGETTAGRQLVTVTNQLSEARADLAAKEARARELSGSDRADTATLSSDLVQKLREQEAAVAQQVAQLQQRYDSSYPPLEAARSAMADIHARIGRETQRVSAAAQSDLAIAQGRVAQLEQSFGALTNRLGTTHQDELTASQLEREIDADRRLYDDLLSRSKQVAIQDQLQEPDTRIVSGASLPLRPNSPKRGMLLAISAVAAALIAGLWTAVLDRLGSTRSRSMAEVEAASRLPSLAVIPAVPKRGRGIGAPLPAGSTLAAALQTLGNSIALRRDEARPPVTVFVSSIPGEGKTFLAALYGNGLASPDRRVLLVDADLRRAGLSRAFGLSGSLGLADCLAGRPLADCIRADVQPGLDILPAQAGQGDPSALLSAERARAFLDEAVARYAAVVIDAPPILAVDDCLHLVRWASATVLVVRWGHTPLSVLASAVRRLRLGGGTLVGVALNAADPRRLHSYDGASYAPGLSQPYGARLSRAD